MKIGSSHRPIIVAIAGSNGAGKSTFFYSHLKDAGLRFVNADILKKEIDLTSEAAARAAKELREELLRQGESFIFETVFSDPVGEKIQFLKDAVHQGYQVILCFIFIESVETSEQRVAIRVSQGEHDVPRDKIHSRFPRTLKNLKSAIKALPYIVVFNNEDMRIPFSKILEFENGKAIFKAKIIPKVLSRLLDTA